MLWCDGQRMICTFQSRLVVKEILSLFQNISVPFFHIPVGWPEICAGESLSWEHVILLYISEQLKSTRALIIPTTVPTPAFQITLCDLFFLTLK